MKRNFLIAIAALAALAQGANRPVNITWASSTTPGVQGYNILKASSPTGNFVKLNTALIVGNSYTDTTAVVGQPAYYVGTAVIVCTMPPQDPCGESAPSAPPVGIASVPGQPGAPANVVLVIQ